MHACKHVRTYARTYELKRLIRDEPNIVEYPLKATADTHDIPVSDDTEISHAKIILKLNGDEIGVFVGPTVGLPRN